MVKKKTGSVKRFGPRYGRTTRSRVAGIESEQKRKHKCPYCHSNSVKRVSAGIWSCKKCSAKFAARAYSPKVRSAVSTTEEA